MQAFWNREKATTDVFDIVGATPDNQGNDAGMKEGKPYSNRRKAVEDEEDLDQQRCIADEADVSRHEMRQDRDLKHTRNRTDGSHDNGQCNADHRHLQGDKEAIEQGWSARPDITEVKVVVHRSRTGAMLEQLSIMAPLPEFEMIA